MLNISIKVSLTERIEYFVRELVHQILAQDIDLPSLLTDNFSREIITGCQQKYSIVQELCIEIPSVAIDIVPKISISTKKEKSKTKPNILTELNCMCPRCTKHISDCSCKATPVSSAMRKRMTHEEIASIEEKFI